MPCSSEQCYDSGPRPKDFLMQVGFNRRTVEHWNWERQTRTLCTWCNTHDVKAQSLELQIWWRDHQHEDRERRKQQRPELVALLRLRRAIRLLPADERDFLHALLRSEDFDGFISHVSWDGTFNRPKTARARKILDRWVSEHLRTNRQAS